MVNFYNLVYFYKNTFIKKSKKMAIEIRELVIRASVERKIVPAGGSLTDDEKRKLKAEVLAHCLKELNRNTNSTINTKNTINR